MATKIKEHRGFTPSNFSRYFSFFYPLEFERTRWTGWDLVSKERRSSREEQEGWMRRVARRRMKHARTSRPLLSNYLYNCILRWGDTKLERRNNRRTSVYVYKKLAALVVFHPRFLFLVFSHLPAQLVAGISLPCRLISRFARSREEEDPPPVFADSKRREPGIYEFAIEPSFES